MRHTCVQILVATSTLAWGVNTPAHLVVIKGTEYYDAPSRRYVDFPITDVLQVCGGYKSDVCVCGRLGMQARKGQAGSRQVCAGRGMTTTVGNFDTNGDAPAACSVLTCTVGAAWYAWRPLVITFASPCCCCCCCCCVVR